MIYQIVKTQKTTFSAFVILGDTGVMNCGQLLKTCKVPYLMYLKPDGYLSEYTGPINIMQLKKHLAAPSAHC